MPLIVWKIRASTMKSNICIMSNAFVPLSVRQGSRDPLPYSEGVPGHIRQQAFSWVASRVYTSGFAPQVSLMVARLGMPVVERAALEERVMEYCRSSDEAFLDVLDYLLHTRTTEHHPRGASSIPRRDIDTAVQTLSDLLDAGRSCWKVSWVEEPVAGKITRRRYCLERRVTEAAEGEYLRARGIGGKAGEKLTEAWHAAYGREESAEQCWKSSIAAVEAALQPVVSPRNPGAGLGAMRRDIRAAPQNWECDLPVWGDEGITSVDAFLNVLNRITYENGRHGGDARTSTMREARAVLMVAVTVVEWMRDEVFRRVKSD